MEKLSNLEELAGEYAKKYHSGQLRKDLITPYHEHCFAVAEYVKEYAKKYPNLNINEETIAIALLHDTIEDTSATYKDIENNFGNTVAEGVLKLTRDCSRSDYKIKIKNSSDEIKLIKLCDVLHNIMTLTYLSPEGVKRKVNDSYDFYIPIAEEICPELGSRIKNIIDDYVMNNN
jgi:GTP diphosphokinase / guanosine-3',5'-bis(diphosphate) 3'-diphosphatase